MRASSVGLEVEVEISKEELVPLKSRFLGGILKFRDNHGTPNRDIPLYMFYSPFQKERVEYKMDPSDGYFGNVNHLEFTVNGEVYRELEGVGVSDNRFSVGGKLNIKVTGETHKNL